MKINHTSWKSVTLAVTASLLMSGAAAAGGPCLLCPACPPMPPPCCCINTVDVIAVQRHFLGIGTPLTGCRLVAADVNADSMIDTSDAIAIFAYFLGLTIPLVVTGTPGGCDLYGNTAP